MSGSRSTQSGLWAALAFAVAAGGAAAPIALHPLLPLVDLPNHIARLHIAGTGGAGPLADYYTYRLAPKPNAAADLLWALTGRWGDPVHFVRATLVAYAVALVGGTMVLARVAWGRWSPWPAASALVVYSGAFFWGFHNFVLSVPGAVLGLALWLATERWRTRWRVALFVPVALALYGMHFFGFAALAIGAFGREVQRLAGGETGWRQTASLALPFLGPTVWTAVQSLDGPPSSAGAQSLFGGWSERLEVLRAPVLSAPAEAVPAISSAGDAALALFAGALLLAVRRRGLRLTFAPALKGPVIALAVVALAMPFWLNGVAMTHLRLPAVLAAVLFAATEWRGLTRGHAALLAAAVAGVLTARAVSLDRYASAYDADLADLTAVLAELPEGARLLPLRAPGQEPDRRLWHVAAVAVWQRQAFVPTLFQGVDALDVRTRWEDRADPATYPTEIDDALNPGAISRVFIRNWPAKFTHVLTLDRGAEGIEAGPVRLLSGAGRFTLYAVVR
ncbi:hypothetical protein DXV76_09665 [Rhodobacteraceae bacterium CCMM004]|nr:hypothetical protein DXV76_09665 [Rhodobacteraceae bacterium CCMM004]